jgi:phthiocerol/phenolphthiocerol synthesis type-I polyketide synthase E
MSTHPNFDASSSDAGESLDLAIVGISCRFPGARDRAQFWQLLREGKPGISELDAEALDRLGVPASRREREQFVAAAPLLDEHDCFDAGFFGYSPADSAMLDPQHRVFLESAWHALEDAGHGGGRDAGVVGVFAGTSLSTYLLFNLMRRSALAHAEDTFPAMVANDKDFLSTRVSYHLGLQGPSLDVQTGCSTSLVALHLACQHLLTFECDTAIAGGVSIHMPQRAGYVHTPGGIGSADGHCRAYDASGTGTVFGSGVGVVVVRRLADALRDGDPIYAVIKGSAINNDGNRKVGFTAPSVDGQAQVIRRALAVANLTPDRLGMIEGHGTGTQLGDPVEVTALQQVFADAGALPPRSCVLGSVKSNIGHLDAAAGVAGLIKATLAVQHGVIPGTLHFAVPNPGVAWEQGPLFVSSQLEPWPSHAGPRCAGVSAFGIGGTNAHVLIEEAPARPASGPSRRMQLVPLSARSSAALAEQAGRLAEALRADASRPLADVAWTLQVGRAAMPVRQIAVAGDPAELLPLLGGEATGAAGARPRLAQAEAPSQARRISWVFPGGGAQYLGMGADLYRDEPVFRDAFDACVRHSLARRGLDLHAAVYGAAAGDALTRPSLALPALFAVEYALAQLWRSIGVEPVAMAGHSMGEYVAACLAGVFTLEAALELVAERGRLFETLPAGGMVSVLSSEAEVSPLLGPGLSIAAINGPQQCVVAGSLEAVEALCPRLSQAGLEFRQVPIDVAAHSPAVEPILPAFERFVAGLARSAPTQPFVSGVTGTWISSADAVDPAYWARHLRHTVRFYDVLRTLLDDPSMIVLEVGPGRSLTSAAQQVVDGSRRTQVIASMRARQDQADDQGEWLMALGRLWLAGAAIDWTKLAHGQARQRVSLPGYPFARTRHWLEAELEDESAAAAWAKNPDPARWTYVPSWRRAPLLAGALPARALVLVDAVGADAGLGDAVVRELRQRGVAVEVARRGGPGAAGEHGLPWVADRASYAALLAALPARPEAVVHLWSASPASACAPEAASGQARELADEHAEAAFFAPLHLAQALEEQGDATVRLLLVTSGACSVIGDEPILPERALALGPCRVLPLEAESLQVSVLDVPPEAHRQAPRIAAHIVRELGAAEFAHVAALRGEHRWAEAFEPMPLPAAQPQLRTGGVYLITGGTGDLGLALAHHLARTCAARLALVSRSPLPPRQEWQRWRDTHHQEDLVSRRLERVAAIEAAGGEVRLLAADVSDAAAMAAVVAEVTAAWGPIHGVIHAAGVPAAGAFQLKTREAVAPVIAAKVRGAQVLRALFATTPLDFLVLFSSRSAAVGDLGQIDHCAANAALDAMAALGDRDGGAAVRSIGWDAWKEIGQAVTTELPPALAAHRHRLLEHALTTDEALGLWDRVVASGAAHVVVSTQHLPTVARDQGRWLRSQLLALSAGAAAARQLSSESYVAPASKLEHALHLIWGEALGIADVGVHDNFFDLGGNSLVALRVLRAIRSQLGVELPPTSLFEAPTIARLAALLDRGTQPEETPLVDERRDRGARRRERQAVAHRAR